MPGESTGDDVTRAQDHAEFDQRHLDAIADADVFPYWYEDVDEPESNSTLVKTESCDLCNFGGGYTGLWTAIIAKERDPSRDVGLRLVAQLLSGGGPECRSAPECRRPRRGAPALGYRRLTRRTSRGRPGPRSRQSNVGADPWR